MKYTNKFGLPETIALALSTMDDHYGGFSTDPKTISVTTAIAPPLQRRLRLEHEDEIEQDVSDMIWMLDGKAMHYIMELAGMAGAGTVVEKRLECRAPGGWKLHGALDLIDRFNILWDYKSTSVWALMRGVKPEWEAQVNMYDMLARLNGINVDGLRIMAKLRDWSLTDKRKNPNTYPDVALRSLIVRRWTPDKQVAYTTERLALHAAALAAPTSDDAELCTMEERWQDPPSVAVYKGLSPKRATRVFRDDIDAGKQAKELALEWIAVQPPKDSFALQERVSTPRRCLDYCPVAKWCRFGREALAARINESEVPDEMV